MALKELSPMLWTDNLKESIEFYTNILGFTCDEKNENWGWASLSKDKICIMLTKPNEHAYTGKIGFSGSFYFTTENVDELWNDLRPKARVCYEIANFDWGMREFAIYDNNGYILQFGEEVKK